MEITGEDEQGVKQVRVDRQESESQGYGQVNRSWGEDFEGCWGSRVKTSRESKQVRVDRQESESQGYGQVNRSWSEDDLTKVD